MKIYTSSMCGIFQYFISLYYYKKSCLLNIIKRVFIDYERGLIFITRVGNDIKVNKSSTLENGSRIYKKNLNTLFY